MGYTTIQKVRDQGLKNEDRYPDAGIQALIDLYSKFIEDRCRQWFEPRTITALLDGNDGTVIFLPVPVISISALYMNDDFTNAVATTDYRVYSGRSFPDDRKNPKIALVGEQRFSNPYASPVLHDRGRRFLKGLQNQKLIGVFGYTEADGTTPLMIERAVTKLVMRNRDVLRPSNPKISDPGPRGFEMTDGHSVQFVNPSTLGIKPGSYGITQDIEVEQIIAMFKSPIGLAAPGSFVFEAG